MKKLISTLLSICMLFLFVGCANSNEVIYSKESIETNVEEIDMDSSNTNLESEEMTMIQIAVSWQDKQVIYELNDHPISNSLLKQLPLTVDIVTMRKYFIHQKSWTRQILHWPKVVQEL